MVWNAEQQSAIDTAIAYLESGDPNSPMVIEGKAGTGKTTIVKEILKKYKSKNIIVGALSNVAKDVIKSSMKADLPRAEYISLAKMLGMKLDPETNTFQEDKWSEKPIEYADIIVIDEASMINEEALELIMKSKPRKSKVLFLGDIGQLSPIRSTSNPYYRNKVHLLNTKSPVFGLSNKSKLVTRVRQGEGSVILPFADHFWENSQSGFVNNPAPSSVRSNKITDQGAILFSQSKKEIVDATIQPFKNAVKTKNPNLIKIVTYKNDTRRNLNKTIHDTIFGYDSAEFNEGELVIFNAPFGQEIDNGVQSSIDSIRDTSFDLEGQTFKGYHVRLMIPSDLGDPKLQTVPVIASSDKAAYGAYLGKLWNEASALRGKDRFLYKKALDKFWKVKNGVADLDYAYAITSHKSQGSTYDMVVVDEMDIMGVSGPSIQGKSESIYTAITRARNATVIISAQPVESADLPNLVDVNNRINEAKSPSFTPPTPPSTPPPVNPTRTEVVIQQTPQPPVQTPQPPVRSEQKVDVKVAEALLQYNDEALRKFMNKHVIPGLSPQQQYSLVTSMGLVINEALNDGLSPQDIINEYYNDLLPQLIEEEQSEVGKQVLKTVQNNKKAVVRKVAEYISKIRDARFEMPTDDDVNEDIEIMDGEGIKDRTDFSDTYSITVNHKNTASGRLKALLASVRNVDANGDTIVNFFGIEEVVPFDYVYNNVQAVLAGSNPDYAMMVDRLMEASRTKPFLAEVVNTLENADQHIKNEFVKNMTKHGIQMKFMMWKQNKDGSYKYELHDSNSSSMQQLILTEWKSNLRNSSLVYASQEEGESLMDKGELGALLAEFDKWIPRTLPVYPKLANEEIQSDVKISNLMKGILEGNDTLRLKETSDMKVGETKKLTYNKNEYLATRQEDGTVKLQHFPKLAKRQLPSSTELRDWFKKLGMNLDPKTMEDLVNGKVYFDVNKRQTPYKDLFSTGGALTMWVKNHLRPRMKKDTSLEISNPIDDSIIKNIVKVESKYAINKFSSSFRTAGKSIATFTNNNFMTNRMKNLKDKNHPLLSNLLNNPFTRTSYILNQFANIENGQVVITNQQAFEATQVYYASLEIMKKYGAKPRKGRELHKLSPLEQEVTRVNMFAANENVVNLNNHDSRKVMLPLLTMSDKTRVMLMEFYARVFKVDSDNNISEDAANEFFKYVVYPEIERMVAAEEGQIPNAKNYKSHTFFMMPSLNEMNEMFLNGKINPDILLAGSQLRANVIKRIQDHIRLEAERKVAEWAELGLTGEENLINSKYFKNMGSNLMRVATDYIMNNYLFNMSSYQMFAGDPALYVKKAGESIQQTFDNVGKRMAMLIAPGSEGAASSSPNSTFKLAVVKDTKMTSEFNDYFKSLGFDYDGINSADAQEYTTWKEHLTVLRQDGIISEADFKKASDLLTKGLSLPKDLLSVVLKPMKPVYVESTWDGGIEKRYYIKSSSIPLLPELTKGFQIDELRKKMESSGIDRVANDTGVKVGAGKIVDEYIDENGNIIPDFEFKSTVTLPRSGFRIQQEIPNKDKTMVIDGTQQRSMLFLNIGSVGGFEFQGEKYDGEALKEIYNEKYHELFKRGYNQLIDEVIQDGQLNIDKIQSVLLKEAYSRGMSENAIESLEVTEDANGNKRFAVPLWLSPHADSIEALLNSIVTNRVLKNPMPGMSLVLASENGFKLKTKVDGEVDQTGILLTDKFTGNLKPQRVEDGVVKPAQVFLPERLMFKGKKVNIREFVDGNGVLDTSKFDSSFLEMFGYRIPTQGPNSMAYIEVVGFIPESMGDIIIAPKEFVKQMGSDFDVDKLYTMNYSTFDYKGTTYNLNKENRQFAVRAKLDTFKKKLSKAIDTLVSQEFVESESKQAPDSSLKSFMAQLMFAADEDMTKHTISSMMKENGISPAFLELLQDEYNKLEAKQVEDMIDEAILKNEILEIHLSVMKNPSKEVQKQVAEPLEYGLLQNGEGTGLDVEISNLKAQKRKSNANFDTYSPLSDSYQKDKFMGGTAGKSGTGVYSVASVFNATLQSARAEDAVTVMEPVTNEKGYTEFIPYSFRLFGKKSDTNIASINTIGSNRPKSQVIAAFQSASVDNENQRILEKLNINDQTFGVTNIMMQMGFSEVEIAYLINQPIIEEYVKNHSAVSGSLDGFVKDVDGTVYRALKEKYEKLSGNTPEVDLSSISLEEAKDMIAGKDIINYPAKQLAFLEQFKTLKEYGTKLQSVAVAINADSKGVPISVSDVSDKTAKLYNLGTNKAFSGIARIVGDYNLEDSDSGSAKVLKIEPKTIKGFASVYGVITANKLFSGIFPFSNFYVEGVVNEINKVLGLEQDSPEASSSRRNIHKAMKSYIYSSDMPIYRGDIRSLRSDLLMDSKTNVSLGAFFNTIKNSDFVQDHPFLRRLSTNLATKGQSYSYVEYDSASNEDLDETLIHTSFAQMFFDDETVIGERNGMKITPKRFAEDLVAYSYLIGGTQDATGFTKYIPVAYLRATGMDAHLSNIKMDANTFGYDIEQKSISDFTRQYMQNNPNLATEVSIDKVSPVKGKLNETAPYIVTKDKLTDKFIRVSHPKNKSAMLFERMENGEYRRLSTLGERKAPEYYQNVGIAQSANPNNNPVLDVTTSPDNNSPLGREYRDYFLDPTSSQTFSDFAVLDLKESVYNRHMGTILAYALQDRGVGFEIQDDIFIKKADGSTKRAAGSYNRYSNRIRMNAQIDSFGKFERVLIHEAVHAVTVGVIQAYNQGSEHLLQPHEIEYAKNINTLYGQVLDFFEGKELDEETAYAISNPKEFVAELMSNRDFQQKLNAIIVPDGSKYKSVFDKFLEAITEFVESISDLLGYPLDERSVLAYGMRETLSLISHPQFRILSGESLRPTNDNDQTNYTSPSEFDYLVKSIENVNESATNKIKKLCQ
jgi:hypothetical protein